MKRKANEIYRLHFKCWNGAIRDTLTVVREMTVYRCMRVKIIPRRTIVLGQYTYIYYYRIELRLGY